MKSKTLSRITLISISALLISGCSTTGATSNIASVKSSHSATATASSEHAHIDLAAIPIGDNKTLTSVPTDKGYLYVCSIVSGGGGAFSSPWAGATTWDSTKKVRVSGSNIFADALNSFTTDDNSRLIKTNGLPADSPAGNFPVQKTDEAYNYDRNPNTISNQDINISVPLNPEKASQPSCTNMGAIGYSVNGVAIFNAIDGENRDAVAHEVQDICDGHPEKSGMYHYHNGSNCLIDDVKNNESKLIGYALDGFGIYAEKDSNGYLKTNSDLDACHGTTSEVEWNGIKQSIYHYSVTVEFPYTVGCFMGSPVKSVSQSQSIPQGNRLPPPPRNH